MAFDPSEVPTKDGMFLRDALEGTFTDVDDAKHTVQVLFPHDTVDTYKTTFDKDAFRDSFKQRLPLMCWQHDLRDPIGHALSAQVTPRHNELVGQFSDFDAVPNSKRAFSQIQDGTITDTSFGFRAPKYEKHPRFQGVRNVRSALMMEFSPVSIGSIPGAIATGLREEEFMQEHSAADIAKLVEAKLISVEAGQRMLAEIPGFREHIVIQSPEQKELIELKAMIRMMSDDREPGKSVHADKQQLLAASGYDPGAPAPIIEGDAPSLPVTPSLAQKQAILSAAGYDPGEEGPLTDKTIGSSSVDILTARIATLEAMLAAAGYSTREPAAADPTQVPATITADAVIAALPDNWQRAIRDSNAVFAIAPEGTEFFRNDELDPESAGTIASAIEAAHVLATDWMKDIDVRSLPEEVQQAVQLWNAAGTSADALLDVLGVEARAANNKYAEPVSPTGAENMAPTKVSCLECHGTGETEDGKTCPQCGGSGVVAMTRDDMPEGAPDDASKCTTCKGSGKIHDGHVKCPECKGKGWMTTRDVEDLEFRLDATKWSDKPWSDFKQSSYSPEEWKRACLIVEGDGSTKDQCKLPVREPDGTYNVNGIAAAASRLNQVQGDKADAADALTHLYRQMKKDVPPEVAKLSNRSDMPTVEELEAQRQAVLDRLDRRTLPRKLWQAKTLPPMGSMRAGAGTPLPGVCFASTLW